MDLFYKDSKNSEYHLKSGSVQEIKFQIREKGDYVSRFFLKFADNAVILYLIAVFTTVTVLKRSELVSILKRSLNLSLFSKELVITLFLSFCVFIVHFLISDSYSPSVIHNNSVNVILEPLRAMLFSHSSLPWRHGINIYTGTPFFLLPFVFLDFSPALFRFILIGMMAGSTAFAFLAYKNIFDLKKAVVGALILLNIDTWTVFRHADYTYSVFFPIILLFLYTGWERYGDDVWIYSASFLAGISFYFKAIVGYMVISLFIGKLLSDGIGFLKELEWKTIEISYYLFLAGLFPFVMVYYNFSETVLEEVFQGTLGKSIVEIFLQRSAQFLTILDPSDFFYFKASWINVLSFIFVLGLLISLIRKRNIRYTYVFFLLFILLLYVPHTHRWTQLLVLVPFVPLIILNLFEEVPDRIPVEAISAFILVIILIFSIPNLADYEDIFTNQPHWAGSQEAYEDYKKLDIEGKMVTNSPKPFVSTMYDFDIQPILLEPENHSKLKRPEVWDWGFVNERRTNLSSLSKGNYTYLLKAKPECVESVEYCGYDPRRVRKTLNLEEKGEEILLRDGLYILIS